MNFISELEFIKNYDLIFLCFLVIVLIVSSFQSQIRKNFRRKEDSTYVVLAYILILFSCLYFCQRELNVGVDTDVYYEFFIKLKSTSLIDFCFQSDGYNDILFYGFTKLFSILGDWKLYLFFCALVYIGGAYFCMKKLFGSLALFSLIVFIISPNFFQFGINVMRNGFAASIFLLSFIYYNRPRLMYFIIFLACLCHVSMVLPAVLFYIYRNTKTITFSLTIWTFSLILQIVGLSIGPILSSLFSGTLSSYLSDRTGDVMSQWIEFITYGASPIITAIYFVHFKQFSDRFYIRCLNVFILIQAIYIQIMDVNYALRFAYLCNFLMPILLIYPLLKRRYWNFQNFTIMSILTSLFIIKTKDLIF